MVSKILLFIKQTGAIIILVAINNCAKFDSPQQEREHQQEHHPDTQTNLYIKYHPLLIQALNEIETSTFSRIRARCDEQVMKWIDEALYSIYEKKPFRPDIPVSGISSIRSLEKDPQDVIKRFLREDERCGIKDYISKVKTTFRGQAKETAYSELELSRVKKLISDLAKMHEELARVFQ